MHIRPLLIGDLAELDIDATIESTHYLHVNVSGEALTKSWSLAPRMLREKLIDPNRPDDQINFTMKQIVAGHDEGLVLAAEHEGRVVASLLGQRDLRPDVLQILDLRVDYDHRRQGLATALIFAAIAHARGQELRALSAQCLTNNEPAARLLARCGFELAGIDTLRQSNHDLVKEAATLLWYLPLT